MWNQRIKPVSYTHLGTTTLKDIENALEHLAAELGVTVAFFQSNYEGAIIEALHAARQKYDYVLLNAGAYTHTSVAIRDAIEACEVPTIEIHLSNIHAREAFRHESLIAPVCVGQITGFGPRGYEMALRYAVQHG